MNVTDLPEIVLPSEEFGLEARVYKLTDEGIHFAVYASNMIPLLLEVTVTGRRKLALADFEKEMTLDEVILEIEKEGQYQVSLIEDFLSLIGNPQFNTKEYCAIVCTGSRFNYIEESGNTSVHTFLEDNDEEEGIKDVHVGLAPEIASFRPDVKFLLVKK
jgi:hypothetical protein